MEKNTKKKKVIITLIIFVILYLGLMMLITNPSRQKKLDLQASDYLILGYDSVWKYRDGIWKDVENLEEVLEVKNFDVYIDNQNKGKYELRLRNDIWNYYDLNGKQMKFSGEILAISTSKNYSVPKIEKQSLTAEDLPLINEQLKQDNISIISINELYLGSKILYDINSDGKQEKLIYFTTMYAEGNVDGKVVSMVMIQEENKTQILKKEIVDKVYEYRDGHVFVISNLLKYNDNNYNIIIKQFRPMGNQEDNHFMYAIQDGKYIQVK